MSFTLNLKSIRKNKGLTQVELAEKINVHQVVISEYENNKCYPSLETFIKLAIVLEVSLEDLIIKTKDKY